MDKNYEQFRQRLQDYEQQPDEHLWEHVSKELRKSKFSYLAVSVIAAAVLLLGFVGVLLFTPVATNNKIASIENPIETVALHNAENETPIRQNESAKEKNESPIHFAETAKENASIAEAESQVPASVNPMASPVVGNESERLPMQSMQQHNALPATQIAKETVSERAKEEPAESVELTKSSSDDAIGDTVRTQLFIPNAFTPGESTNNIFKPAYAEVSSYRMDIYNSRGVLVFTSDNISHGWNGTFNGKDALQGGYYYIVKFTDAKGNIHTQKGSLMLIR